MLASCGTARRRVGGAFIHMPRHCWGNGAQAWAPVATLARSVSESALHFPASDAGASGTGAGGGGASRLSGGTGGADRSGAGDGPDGPSADCSDGGHLPVRSPVSSEKRGNTGSHLEHQLLGIRGPPTALTLGTSSSCSTVDWPAELDGGPAGSEGGAPPLLRDAERWEGSEPDDIKLVSFVWACSPRSLPRASRKASCNPRFTWTLICRSTFALSREITALARSRERREWRR